MNLKKNARHRGPKESYKYKSSTKEKENLIVESSYESWKQKEEIKSLSFDFINGTNTTNDEFEFIKEYKIIENESKIRIKKTK